MDESAYLKLVILTEAPGAAMRRQPRTRRRRAPGGSYRYLSAALRIFEHYQDRIGFGTGAIPPPVGAETPQQIVSLELCRIYYRFIETEDQYFD